jgi:epoxyqueuosine reductase
VISVEQLTREAAQAAAEAGFDLAGVAPVHQEDLPEITAFEEWIDAGHAGEMSYMEKRTEDGALRRASVRHAAPWARSVVVCAMNYNADKPYSVQVNDPQRGWISRYAWGSSDYHDALMPRLRQVETAINNLALRHGQAVQTRCYIDTGPLLERMYAKYAGIGWIGKNTCIINQKIGSWLFLGVILTSGKSRSSRSEMAVANGRSNLSPDLPGLTGQTGQVLGLEKKRGRRHGQQRQSPIHSRPGNNGSGLGSCSRGTRPMGA